MPINRRDWLCLGASFGTAVAAAQVAPARRAAAASQPGKDIPLKIVKIETIIIRYPPDRDQGPEAFVEMTPMGTTTGGIGLWNRLERSETVRQRGHQQTLLVKITTDQGITGWGEAHALVAPMACKHLISDLFAPILLGQDARDIEPIWEKMYSTQKLRGYGSGEWIRAMAGIDIALWDIAGKSAGVPLYRLLGGKFRDRVLTYAAVGGGSVDNLRENAQRLLSQGHTVMKMSFGKGGPGTYGVNRIVTVAEVLKGKGQVLVDSLGAFTLSEATRLGREIDEIGNVGWWEDVLVPEDVDGYARLAQTLDVPICAGEQYSNRYQFRDLMRARAADIINPDVARIGITDMKRIAFLADIHDVLFSPHQGMGGAPYRAASIHLSASVPNFVVLEGGDAAGGPLVNPILKNPLVYKDGHAEIPNLPGLGIDFDEKALAAITVG
jgi:L-alanine-DL-glutamate epimerase-like enolase superfamily enzyme